MQPSQMQPTRVRVLLILTGVLAAANIASYPLSDGAEPLWIAAADVVIGVVMLAALLPAWRGKSWAVTVEVIALVVAGLSAVPGVFQGQLDATIVAAVFTVLAWAVAGMLALATRRSDAVAVAR